MKKSLILIAAIIFAAFMPAEMSAQSGLQRLFGGFKKAAQAYTLSDAQVQAYVHQYITQLDSTSKVLPPDDPYSVRLAKLTSGLTEVDGVPLNFKVYKTDDVNAFACADGSVRVYTGLMDLMTDDEILGVIGHEVGHVAHKDTKDAFKNALLTSALKDGLAASSDRVAVLTDSQLGALGEKLISARYSRRQEDNADDYGYDFLVSHGKNPWAMALAFEKLQQLEGSSPAATSFVNNLFSDHPDVAKRINRMSQRAVKDGYTIPTATISTTFDNKKPVETQTQKILRQKAATGSK